MMNWTQEEIEAMRLADEEIEEDFCMTRKELKESRERDDESLEGQLDFASLRRAMYNRAYNKRYYEQHKGEMLARNHSYYSAHRSKENAKSRAWRRINAEYAKSYQEAYYRENKPYIIAKKQAMAEVERAYRKILTELEAEA